MEAEYPSRVSGPVRRFLNRLGIRAKSQFRLEPAYVDRNLGQRLRRRRRHWIVMVALVSASLGVALFANLTTPELMLDPWKTIFAVGYGLGCSLLASFSIFAHLAHRDLVELVEETPHGLRLLNIVPEMRSDRGRAVIVLPVYRFKEKKTGSEPESDCADSRHVAHLETPTQIQDGSNDKEFSESRRVPLDSNDIRRTAHSRRDVLVVHDILRLFYKAGLPRPIVLKDDDFCKQMLERRHNQLPLTVREDTDEPNALQHRVSAILSIGLFSNRFTIKMSDDERMPFYFDGYISPDDEDLGEPVSAEARQSRRLIVRKPNDDGRPASECIKISVEMPTNEDTGPDTGIVSRVNFRDVPVCFIGGMTALATVRLGDFLFNRPDWTARYPTLAEFASSSRSGQSFCAIVECPGAGNRGGDFTARVEYWDEANHSGLQNLTAAAAFAEPLIHRPSGSGSTEV